MKHLLTSVGIITLACGMWAGLYGHVSVGTFGFLGFVVLLFIANLDRIAEIKASATGIEAKTVQIIAKAENTLSELQLLAKHVGALTLSLVKRNGRLGGYDDEEQELIKNSVLDVLARIGVNELESAEMLDEWHRFTKFDYSHAILGGHMIPDHVDASVLAEWKTLRSGGINNIPTPEQLRTFLVRHALMTDQIEEYIKDYEHYNKHKVHRRPESWRNRQSWGRLVKPK